MEIVRRAWDAFSGGNLAMATETFAPDIEFDVSRDVWGAVTGGGLHSGLDGIANWLRDLYGAWDEFHMEAIEIIDAGQSGRAAMAAVALPE